jgi:hypothetical protein
MPAHGCLTLGERHGKGTRERKMLKYRIRRLEGVLQHLGLAWGAQTKLLPRKLQSPQDLVDVLEEQVEAIRAEPWADTLEKARAIGLLAEIARKAIEARNTADRIESLEAVLKMREGDRQS